MSALRRILSAFFCALLLAGCQEDGPQASESQTAFPDLLALQRDACERDGGRWGLALGKTVYVCYRDTRDANKSCTTESDCQGLCLARSRTCSPIEPFFGCHEVIGSNGLRQTRCVE